MTVIPQTSSLNRHWLRGAPLPFLANLKSPSYIQEKKSNALRISERTSNLPSKQSYLNPLSGTDQKKKKNMSSVKVNWKLIGTKSHSVHCTMSLTMIFLFYLLVKLGKCKTEIYSRTVTFHSFIIFPVEVAKKQSNVLKKKKAKMPKKNYYRSKPSCFESKILRSPPTRHNLEDPQWWTSLKKNIPFSSPNIL